MKKCVQSFGIFSFLYPETYSAYTRPIYLALLHFLFKYDNVYMYCRYQNKFISYKTYKYLSDLITSCSWVRGFMGIMH